MADLLAALRSGRTLLMDGAMGTELQRAGIGSDECHELWNLTHPDQVWAIHQAYADAGAEVFLTNTFQGNRQNLERHGLPAKRLQGYNRRGLDIARSVAGPDRFVLGDVGPILDENHGASYMEVVQSLSHADGLLLETHSRWGSLPTVYYLRIGMGRRLTFLLSLTYRRDPSGDLTTLSGHSPEDFARNAKRIGVAALGVNCGRDIGMDEVIAIVRRYRAVTDLPLFARPNAGTPTRKGKRWVYPQTPEAMAARLPELLEAGVSMVGGCCGTTPEHIAAFRLVIDKWNRRRRA